MKRNEKILAGALGLLVGGYFLRGPIESVTTGPVDELQRTFENRLDASDRLEKRKTAILLASRRMDAARARSLPADPDYAARL